MRDPRGLCYSDGKITVCNCHGADAHAFSNDNGPGSVVDNHASVATGLLGVNRRGEEREKSGTGPNRATLIYGLPKAWIEAYHRRGEV